MQGSSSSGFDVSRMSTAEKLLAGGGILFLIFSFFPWQRFCVELGALEDIVGDVDNCGSASMWAGHGQIFGILAGLLAIALVVASVLSMTGGMRTMNMGTMTPDRLLAFLGLGVVLFGLLKFLFVVTNFVGWAAFVGLVLLAAIGYGAWQKLQESGGFQMGGGTGGSTMGGGTMDGGGTPPSSPPPSSPPPSAPPPSDPTGV